MSLYPSMQLGRTTFLFDQFIGFALITLTIKTLLTSHLTHSLLVLQDCVQLNENVYQVYSSPNIDPSTMPGLDVVLVHGLQIRSSTDAWHDTWLARDSNRTLWPQQWLPDSLKERGWEYVRVLLVSYDADAFADRAVHTGYLDQGQQLLHSLVARYKLPKLHFKAPLHSQAKPSISVRTSKLLYAFPKSHCLIVAL